MKCPMTNNEDGLALVHRVAKIRWFRKELTGGCLELDLLKAET